jgi:hypothetical protein
MVINWNGYCKCKHLIFCDDEMAINWNGHCKHLNFFATTNGNKFERGL